MSILLKFLSAYTRTGLRGSYRLTRALSSRLSSLQDVMVDADGGPVFIDLRIATARGLLANPRSQSGEAEVMRRFINEGDVVFDIGAHFGVYSVLMSSIVGDRGHVFAFEPNPQMLPSIQKTVGLRPNIDLFECGLSDSEGELVLYVPEDASMASFSNWTEGIGGNVHTEKCRLMTIDGLLEKKKIRPPAFIKCDVEGAELSVFKGARKLIDREEAPVILFELNRSAAAAFGYKVEDCLQFLTTRLRVTAFTR
mgnify:FL=1